ncbi:pentatricopeptide repeat-containing protein At1g08070, chloroplastic-like [Cornus florida]|uniref:pentatricopeptide repeat-containing protein At1g08070, chloroplastic-like n=1 Tax=Cornus florida TaxID=4283 RepID=UPI00289A041A|nr:pentatricopeptide repeat-containing protein At1g08070, chloroplastic-like [Cornus florida]
MRHFNTILNIACLKYKVSQICTLNPKQLNQIQAYIVKSPKPHFLNSLLGCFTHSSTPHNALILYNQMLHHPTSHNHFTFTIALKACSLVHAISKGLEIHAHIFKSGHSSDIFIQSSLIHFYVVENDIVSACRIFDAIAHPDVVSWTSIISGLSKCGFEERAIAKFSSMDVKPNSSTLVSLVSACSGVKVIKFGKAVHGYVLKQQFNKENVILDNAILGLYMKCGSLEAARYLFVNMPKRDVFTWTIMVGGLNKRGFCEEAIRVFQDMVERGEVEPNEATIVSVLTACSSLGALSLGRWVHNYLISRHDLTVNGNLGNALINMHSKCGDMDMASQVFNMLTCKDIVSWSTIISGMALNSLGEHALPLFSLMLVHGVPPDDVTFIGVLSACSHAGMIDQGLIFFKAMTNVYGIVPQMQHYACMVDMYGRAGLLEKAEDFIKEMPVEADGPVWGALLNACKSHGNEEMLERITRCLPRTKGVSTGTYALLSNTYASSSKWDDANKIRDEMRNMGLKKTAGCSLIEVDH